MLTLAHPAWLLLLLLLPLFAVLALLVFRLRKRHWDAFVAPRLRGALIRRSSSIPRWVSLFLLLSGSACLIGALSRPQGDAGTRTETAQGRNVLIALDLSRSMRVTDVKPDRLGQAKVIIYELLEKLNNDRIGLIGFAGQANIYAPLTVDHEAVRETVEQIDETWPPEGGSNLTKALELSIKTLKQTGQNNNTLVILSDGEENEGEVDSLIQEAERAGVCIFSIGIGTDDGGFVPNPDYPNNRMLDRNGQPVLSVLHNEVMQKLANGTNGRHAIAGTGANIPEMVAATVEQMDTFELKGRERRVIVEYYQWLLFPGIIFLILSVVLGTRWRALKPHTMTATAALVFGLLFFSNQPVRADEVKDAKQALKQGKLKEAQKDYKKLADESTNREQAAKFRVGEGTAAYRGDDFRSARGAFSQSLLSDDPKVRAGGHIGMGNTLFQLGWQGLADETYPEESQQPPDLDKFKELVLKRLAAMQKSDLQDEGDTQDFIRIDSLMANWADAIRHYRSALDDDPGNARARHNSETTMIYLKKLQEILKEEQEKAKQAMPQIIPGQGPPQEGDDGDNPDGENGNGDQEGNHGKGDKQSDKDGNGDKKKDDKDGEDGKDKGDPNESAEERARRLLKENSDLEKGPLNPGRYRENSPEKDW